MKQQVKIKKLNSKAMLPTYGSEYSAGADLYACMEETVTIKPAAAWQPKKDWLRRIKSALLMRITAAR